MKKKASALKLWFKYDISDDVWREILSRIPVKSLLRFRSVSRSWNTWIAYPNFTRLHLHHFNNRSHCSQMIFIRGRFQCECVVKNSETLRTNFSLGPVPIPSIKPIPVPLCNIWSIVSSTDGLLLLKWYNPSVYSLWNPSIRKDLDLPQIPLPKTAAHIRTAICVDFGLGFDPFIGDYKAVRIILPSKTTESWQFAAVYTLGTNSWQVKPCRIEGLQYSNDLDVSHWVWNKPISCNGALYCITRSIRSLVTKLYSFDLMSEVITSIDLPVYDESDESQHHIYWLATVDNGGSLAVIEVSETTGTVWVLETKPCRRWIQRYSFAAFPESKLLGYVFMYLNKNGQMLMKWDKKVICYNLETGQHNLLMEKNRRCFEPQTFTYIESLILHNPAHAHGQE